MGGRGLLEQQFRRFLSAKFPQYQLMGGEGVAEVGGAKKRKQSAPRKAYHQPLLKAGDGDQDKSTSASLEVS